MGARVGARMRKEELIYGPPAVRESIGSRAGHARRVIDLLRRARCFWECRPFMAPSPPGIHAGCRPTTFRAPASLFITYGPRDCHDHGAITAGLARQPATVPRQGRRPSTRYGNLQGRL